MEIAVGRLPEAKKSENTPKNLKPSKLTVELLNELLPATSDANYLCVLIFVLNILLSKLK